MKLLTELFCVLMIVAFTLVIGAIVVVTANNLVALL